MAECETCKRPEGQQSGGQSCWGRAAAWPMEAQFECYAIGFDHERVARQTAEARAIALEAVLLGYVKEHDARKQKGMGPEYSDSECDCDLCCAADNAAPRTPAPEYKRVDHTVPRPITNERCPKCGYWTGSPHFAGCPDPNQPPHGAHTERE